jgi:hypothetical protein
MRAVAVLVVAGVLVSRVAAFDDRAVRVEHSKPLPRDTGLGTQAYAPTDAEKTAIKEWKSAELNSGTDKVENLLGNVDKRVAWFGIIREVREDKESDTTRLVVEMKYFDGLTDLHLQIVSINGAGDFAVKVPGTGHTLKTLSLVRVYGKVTGEREAMPEVAADFVRSWDWKLFAFMPYGKDHSNPKWVKLRKVEDELDVYDSNPTNAYHEKLLGKRSAD